MNSIIYRRPIPLLFFLLVLVIYSAPVIHATDGRGEQDQSFEIQKQMDNDRLDTLLRRLGEDVSGKPGFWQLMVENRIVTVITDENHDRMRIISPVAPAEDLEPELLIRLMQANFDSALDARYAIAKNAVWSVFIHPLSTLDDVQVLNGIGQVVNLVITYGKSFSSGLLVFQGGDSQEQLERRQLIDDLLEKGLEI